jgi:hypothetical protein
MLEYLLGANGIAKITLVTTKWTKDASEAVRKEEEKNERMLQDDYWQGPMKCGSTLERYDGTKASSIDILANLKTRKRRMHPEPSRCRMSTQAPIPEAVPETDLNQPTWMDMFKISAWKWSLPASQYKSDLLTWVRSIGSIISWILFPFGDHGAQSDVTTSILVPPTWLWTPAWIVIASIHRFHLLLVIEERTRVGKCNRLLKYMLIACAYYIFGNLRKPEWLDFAKWYRVKATLLSVTTVMNATTFRDDGRFLEIPYWGVALFLLAFSSGFVHVPLWFPIWAIYLGEGLRLVLLLLACLLIFLTVTHRWENWQACMGRPRVSLTQYEPLRQRTMPTTGKLAQETLPAGYRAFPPKTRKQKI